MVNILFNTTNEWTGFVLRLTIAFIIFPHGAQKLLGWFGGFGYSGTMGFFTQSMELPWFISFLVILIESLGPIFLVAGFGSRLWSLGLIAIMVGAIVLSHKQYGFFMNWFGAQKGEGFEFHLLMIGAAIALLLIGSGKYSLDRLLAQ